MPTHKRIKAIRAFLMSLLEIFHIRVHELLPYSKFVEELVEIPPVLHFSRDNTSNEIDSMAISLVGHAETMQKDVFSVSESRQQSSQNTM
jgi:hypothetical protein